MWLAGWLAGWPAGSARWLVARLDVKQRRHEIAISYRILKMKSWVTRPIAPPSSNLFLSAELPRDEAATAPLRRLFCRRFVYFFRPLLAFPLSGSLKNPLSGSLKKNY